MSGKACTVDQLVSILNSNNAKVIEALAATLRPVIEDALTVSLSDICVKLNDLSTELKCRDEKIKQLETHNAELKTKLLNYEIQLDQLETYTKQDNLLIHGIPAQYAEAAATSGDGSTGESTSVKENSATTEQIFLNFCANRLGVVVQPEDISACHRLRKLPGSKHPPIIIRFTNRKARSAVLAARRRLQPPSDKGTSSITERIYINEHLTKLTSRLFADARKMVKSGRINQTWTYNGRVTVKLRDNTIRTVNTHSELDSLP